MSGRDIADALEALTGTSRFGGIGEKIEPSKERGGRPAQESSARNQSGFSAVGEAVMTEVNFSDREFHPDRQLTSTDGLVTIVLKPVKKMVFRNDKSGQVVTVNFAEPND